MSYDPVILVTGFEPFFGNPLNPSWEAAKRLPDEVLGCRIVKRELPVEWFECSKKLEEYVREFHPRAVISAGQGYPRPPVLIERLGMNICSGMDNTGQFDMYEEPVFYGGPAAYFSTFPYKAIHSRLKAEGIPAMYSFNAGQNQCNCILYTALHLAAMQFPGMVAGFIHVPMLPDEEKGIPGMPIEETARALLCCVEETARFLHPPVRTIDQYREDI